MGVGRGWTHTYVKNPWIAYTKCIHTKQKWEDCV